VPVATQRWYLHVLDSKTGEKLWTADATMGGKLWRSWGSIAKSLLSDIQKRLRDVK
jgi:glucose dehydrogenase